MIIECISCSKNFELKDDLLPPGGSKVRCGACSEVWFFHPKKSLEENENSNQDMSFLSNTDSEVENYQTPLEKEVSQTLKGIVGYVSISGLNSINQASG